MTKDGMLNQREICAYRSAFNNNVRAQGQYNLRMNIVLAHEHSLSPQELKREKAACAKWYKAAKKANDRYMKLCRKYNIVPGTRV